MKKLFQEMEKQTLANLKLVCFVYFCFKIVAYILNIDDESDP